MVNTQQQHKNLHAIFIAYPLQGHVIPAVHLAIKLASKGFTITFINTESIHHRISQSDPQNTTSNHNIFTTACKSGLDIRYYTISDGLPTDYDRSLNNDQFNATLLHVISAHVDFLLQKIIPSSDPPITCLIADTFFVWPSTIANKFNLPSVSFWTEPALVFTLYYHLDLLRKNRHFGIHDKREDTIDYIPGVPAIEPTDLTSYLQEMEVSLEHQIINKAFKEAKEADFVLCNTVQELEPDTIAALQVKKPFYAIGPIFPIGFTKSNVATSLWAESDCTQWLNGKPNGSVLYISFGSYAHVRKQDIIEIANGILLSQVNFIWVLRPDIVSSDDQNPLPDQFFEECRDRGMIVPWCKQMEVLTHPSVGGFFTHCGWNSILESIWCGVPFLCFPLLTDQFTNRKLIVDDWKIGLDINPRKPKAKEVSNKINSLMSGKLSDEFKIKIKEVKKTLQNAVEDDGSSEKNLNIFIDELKARTSKRFGDLASVQPNGLSHNHD